MPVNYIRQGHYECHEYLKNSYREESKHTYGYTCYHLKKKDRFDYL